MNFVDFLFNDPIQDPSNLFLLGKEEIDYHNLIENVSSLSFFLKEKYGENKNIILCSPNNTFFIISYLAIIHSGNICIPIDPLLSARNLEYLLKETNPAIIFNSILSRVDMSLFGNCEMLNENNLETLLKNKREYLFWSEFYPERLAAIIFTSGSTGTPKGVMLSHLNLTSNTKSISDYLKLNNSDRMLVVMPFYYCYGLSLLHTHLKCRGSIVINSSFLFLGGVINDLIKYNCTGFAGVPSHFQVLLRKSKSFVLSHFPSLRYVTQAGGKLHNVFIEEFISSFNNISFFVMYGQTEATSRLSYLPPELLTKKMGSIGKGIPGVTLKVVNEKFQQIKPGQTGEVIAKGDNIMLGYYHDIKLTNSTLVKGWLKTGDLATTDEDGFIYLVARSKEIFKIRGKRVSPKEIEEVIMKLNEVVDCSISSIYDEIEGEAIEAKILLADGFKGKICENDIKNHCKSYLESYKIPSKITILDKLNVNNSGKHQKE